MENLPNIKQLKTRLFFQSIKAALWMITLILMIVVGTDQEIKMLQSLLYLIIVLGMAAFYTYTSVDTYKEVKQFRIAS